MAKPSKRRPQPERIPPRYIPTPEPAAALRGRGALAPGIEQTVLARVQGELDGGANPQRLVTVCRELGLTPKVCDAVITNLKAEAARRLAADTAAATAIGAMVWSGDPVVTPIGRAALDPNRDRALDASITALVTLRGH